MVSLVSPCARRTRHTRTIVLLDKGRCSAKRAPGTEPGCPLDETRASLDGSFIKEGNMQQFILGILFGTLITGTVVGAGKFYDSKGNLKAPSGSQQQFDYFRERQMFIDINNMRKQMEQQQLDRKLGKNPC